VIAQIALTFGSVTRRMSLANRLAIAQLQNGAGAACTLAERAENPPHLPE
jgi:hypothetical protein